MKKRNKRNKWILGALSAAVVSHAFVAPAMASTSNEIEATAKAYLGTPYVWAGTSPSGFDCSGYIQYVFKQQGIDLPRSAAQQFNVGTSVSKGNLQKGDLVFFTTYKEGPSHVGIYLGNGQFINASSSKGVSIASIDSSYWGERYLGAKRVLSGQQTASVSSYNHSEITTKQQSGNEKTTITNSVNKNPVNHNSKQQPNKVVNTEIETLIETVEVKVEEDRMQLDEDGQTYTVRSGDTLSAIGSNFDVSVEKLKLLNEKEDNLINIGEKILVKGEPKLKVTLFEEVPSDELKDETSEEIVFLPIKDFEQTEQQKLMFEQKPMTKAELATTIKFFVENNPSSVHLLKEYGEEIEATDISDEHWAKHSIEWAVSNGFMKLDNNGEFHPEEEVSVDDTDLLFDTLYKQHELTETDVDYIQEQMDENEYWTYEYTEKLIYNISLELATNEEKQEVESKELQDKQEVSPTLAMAKDRVEQITGNMLLGKVAIVPLINQNLDVKE